MAKQTNGNEEDYLDSLLNSILSAEDEIDDDMEELSDKEFFDALEKEWMEENVQETPEDYAKKMMADIDDIWEEERREAVPDEEQIEKKPKIKSRKRKASRKQQEAENIQEESVNQQEEIVSEEEFPLNALFGNSADQENIPDKIELEVDEPVDDLSSDFMEPTEPQMDLDENAESETESLKEDDLIGLYDILGVEKEPEKVDEELAELEKDNGKKKNKKKGKKEKKQKKNLKELLFGSGKQGDASSDIEDAMGKIEQMGSDADDGSQEQINNKVKSDVGLADDELSLSNLDDFVESAQFDVLGERDLEEEIEEKTDKKKEKKKKKAKPKKPKKAKPKKPKKPKKERTPRQKSTEMVYLSGRAFLLFASFGVLIIAVSLFGGQSSAYQNKIQKATNAYISRNYSAAYHELYGVDMREEDEYFFHQVQTIMYVYRGYEAYQNLVQLDEYEDALDSLLTSVSMFDKYKDSAREDYNCLDEMNVVLELVVSELSDIYGINESQARELNLNGRDKQYSIKVAEIAAAARERALKNDSNS